jgi:hypothetical protein
VSPKKRNSVGESSATRGLSSPAPRTRLADIRAELRAAISKLKALGCEDSMVLVEFWHALDCVNGEEYRDR